MTDRTGDTDAGGPPGLRSSAEIDTTVSRSGRVRDHRLGGKENYPADRRVGDRIAERFPQIVEPGLVSCPRWDPEARPFGEPKSVDLFCAVGRKP